MSDQSQDAKYPACGQSGSTGMLGCWQPISTAPKDGTEIDVWDSYSNSRNCDVSYDAKHNLWFSREGPSSDHEDVTHWMPLPPPPNVEVRGEDCAAGGVQRNEVKRP
jgi:hypothetical protein